MTIRAIKIILHLSLGVVSLFLLHCVGNPTLAGGVETTNGLTVVASGLTMHGCAPVGSTVSIFSDSFNPIEKYSTVFSDSALVDSERTFSFNQIKDSGIYNVIAINSLTHRGAIVSSLYMRPGGYDSIFIPFSVFGEIQGFLLYVKNSDTIALKSYSVYCKGSNFFTQSDSSGYYKISNVPLGKYGVVLVPQESAGVGTFDNTIEQAAALNDKNLIVNLDFVVK